ncbi:hypothetical protein K1719_018466 [Acacia pycnantha]|nr:hypothetical protein K1719_018466 [Acacia pycnantha]
MSNKTPEEARELISIMADNSQQFGTRANSTPVYHIQAPPQMILEIRDPTPHPLCLCKHHLLDQPYVHLHKAAQQEASSSGGGSSLEDMMKQFVTANMRFQQRTDTSIQSLQTQIGQLATSLNQLQPQGSNSLPSPTIPNPKGNVSAISLLARQAIGGT